MQQVSAPMENTKNTSFTKPYSMEANVEAALSYLITPITGILVFVTEKENKFVRFHAFQSILFGIASMGALSIAESLKIILIGYILKQALSVFIALAWFYLMWQAYNNNAYELPFLGKIAKDQTYKPTA